MPNIGAMLKQEIARLSRREVRSVTETTRKGRRAAPPPHRGAAPAGREARAAGRGAAASAPGRIARGIRGGSGQKMRFVAKGLKSQRSRLGLSAADYGRLVGVTAQSVYNWEGGNATPRGDQLARIAALRSIGKREAMARLEQAGAKKAKRSR
jgi:DNA-binding XRE family transcriptional regulator